MPARGENAKSGHSELCRKRVEELMKGDEIDRKKLDDTKDRMNQHLARQLEQDDRKRKAKEEADDRENMEGVTIPTEMEVEKNQDDENERPSKRSRQRQTRR